MNILSRYVLRDFLTYFLLCLTALVLLVFVANTFGNIDSIFRSWESLRDYLEKSGRSLPTVLEFTLPFSVLIATVITFTGFSRTFELVAMKSSGMGMTRLIGPVLLVLIPISALTYLNQNYFFSLLNPEAEGEIFDRNQWRVAGDRIIFLGTVNSASNGVTNVQIFRSGKGPYRISEIVKLEVGSLRDPNWIFQNITKRKHTGEVWKLEQVDRLGVPAPDFPNVFKPVEVDAHHMALFDLYDETRQLGKTAPQLVIYLLEWYQKSAALCALFVMVLVGAPLAQLQVRKGRVAGELAVTVLVGIVFLICNEIFLIFGRGGFFPPLISAWGANLLFGSIAGVLLLRVR